ncbi:hypothetical protein DM02DRAFT_355609 [Periconia macrospinosa]|uniref:Uncharacterized protein n=1 Tax=Periconia macrospinosa TaxID=97972 RepID=A0A2V1E9H5_9PLEO|nr:hypothetical protein DM02DRAFT_355609 [Periconia macrospinosa]
MTDRVEWVGGVHKTILTSLLLLSRFTSRQPAVAHACVRSDVMTVRASSPESSRDQGARVWWAAVNGRRAEGTQHPGLSCCLYIPGIGTAAKESCPPISRYHQTFTTAPALLPTTVQLARPFITESGRKKILPVHTLHCSRSKASKAAFFAPDSRVSEADR